MEREGEREREEGQRGGRREEEGRERGDEQREGVRERRPRRSGLGRIEWSRDKPYCHSRINLILYLD